MSSWPSSLIARAAPLVVAIFLAPTFAGCQCGSKASRVSGVSPDAAQPAPGPASPAPSAASAPAPAIDPSVGETVPPIEPDKVAVVDTSNGGGLKHLIFKSTDKLELGRNLSEYFMVIRASKPSCIRIKMRPTASVADKIADEIAQSGDKGAGPCAAAGVGGEQVPTPASPTPASPAPSPGPASPLHLVASHGATSSTGASSGAVTTLAKAPDHYDFIDPTGGKTLALTAATLSRCAHRLFRMETNTSQSENNLDKFVTKTGRLVSIGSRVRIWVDDEYSNVCAQGGSFDSTNKISFGPLIQEGVIPADVAATPVLFADKTWQAQVDTLASEMDRMVIRMTRSLGGLSDVDQSGFVEIFLTPEVNRTKLIGHANLDVDNFRASYVFKPQDLAYYNAESNPTSNEGEILYLWVPDPAGIFTTREFPSSNSLTSNYAKGYLATQLSGLIYLNEKILKQKQKSVSDTWLIYALGLANSKYYAGIDYSTFYFAQYFTSRSQYISLSAEIDKSMFSAKYLPFAYDEQMGMRGLFGWYLHTALCGVDALTPCEAMARFYTSAKSGSALVEEVLGTTYDAALKNFGLSLAIGLAEKRADIIKLWDNNPAGFPPRPSLFKDLTEIYPSEPPLTEEEDNKSALLLTPKVDRTVAGPYPSRKMLFVQPLAPDYDLEFKLVPDSIAVVQPMGFVSETTDAAAILGDGLNVVFVPIGERDPTLRSVHYEKLSERAPGDVRPVNLANKSDPFSTFSSAPFYQTDVASPDPNQFTVTKSREVWSFGSLDNFYINKEGSKAKIGDTDSLNVEFQPCSGITDAALLAACQAKTHKAVVQLVIRDLDQELAPMLMVTSSDRKIFRGHSILDQVKDVDGDFEEIDGQVSVLCEASHTTNSVTNATTNPNGDKTVMAVTYMPTSGKIQSSIAHGLQVGDKVYFTASDSKTPPGVSPFYAYTVSTIGDSGTSVTVADGSKLLSFISPSNTGATQYMHRVEATTTCANGGVKGAPVFSDLQSRPSNISQPPSATTPDTGYNHNYVNYLMQGVLGYPFSTRRSVSYVDMPECPGDFCYLAYEADRQFLQIALDKTKKPTTYVYYPGNSDYDRSLPMAVLDADTVAQAASLKRTMDDPLCAVPLGATSVELCTTLSGLDETTCKKACAANVEHQIVNSAIVANFAAAHYFGICRLGTGCQALTSLMAEGYPYDGNAASYRTSRWLDPGRFLMYERTPDRAATLTTHYLPVEPERSSSYCLGIPDDRGSKLQRCGIKSRSLKAVTDLREQLQVASDRMVSHCFNKKLVTDVDVCIDNISYTRELRPEEGYAFTWAGLKLPTDRARLRRTSITDRAGEILAKPERLHYVVVEVPGTGTVANILVGGRKQSQGKYLIRARLVDWQ